MIKIDRNQVEMPKCLEENESTGLKETNEVIDFYSIEGNLNKPYEYKAYSNEEVKSTLIKLFNYKCAYCESKITDVSFGDIEHFRPKGEIDLGTSRLKPGYYWLAAKWDNLLLACSKCNCRNSDVDCDGNKPGYGKGNRFPLADESNRARKHNDNKLPSEEAYLLNPCEDNPEEHLEYFDSGKIKAKSINGQLSNKGEQSINIYGLTRKDLTESREEHFDQIKYVIESITYLLNTIEKLERSESLSDSEKEQLINENLGQIKKGRDKLSNYLKPDKKYLALSKQLILPFFDDVEKKLSE